MSIPPKSPKTWAAVFAGKKASQRADFILSDLIGYRKTSLHRADDLDNITHALTAIMAESAPTETAMIKPVHIEDLFERMQGFMTAAQHTVATRQYSQIDSARASFIAWCKEHGLELDFAERS